MDKKILFKHCENMLMSVIEEYKHSISSYQLSSNNDTKSSMGDKYETTREMLQQEINSLQKQLSEMRMKLFNLRNIQFKAHYFQIELGALVVTTLGTFFIAVSIGKIIFENQNLVLISMASPLGKQLSGKKNGDFFILNNKEQQILNVI